MIIRTRTLCNECFGWQTDERGVSLLEEADSDATRTKGEADTKDGRARAGCLVRWCALCLSVERSCSLEVEEL